VSGFSIINKLGRIARRDSLFAGDYGSKSIDTADILDDNVTEAKLDPECHTFGENGIINGDFQVWQRGGVAEAISSTSNTVNDDANFCADRWIQLLETNGSVNFAKETSVIPPGADSCIRMTTQDNSGDQFGIATQLEDWDSYRFWKNGNGTATLSFKARSGGPGNITDVRGVVLGWTTAPNTATRDLVNAWQVDPTYVAGYAEEGAVSSSSVIGTAWTTVSVTVTLDLAGTDNLVVAIFCNQTTYATGDILYIADVRLEEGSTAGDYIHRSFESELSLCRRYYEKTYPHDVTPDTETWEGAHYTIAAQTGGASVQGFIWPFHVRKRTGAVTANVTSYNPTTAAATTSQEKESGSGTAAPDFTDCDHEWGVFYELTIGTSQDYGVHLSCDVEIGA